MTYIDEFFDSEKSSQNVFLLIFHPNKLHCVCNWYVEAANLENIITFNYLEAIDVNKINNKLNLKPMYNLRLTQAQPFDKWQKIENAQYFRDFGNKIFSQYQHQYPDIFPSSDFDIENHV